MYLKWLLEPDMGIMNF